MVDWTRDEILVVAAVVVDNGWRAPSKSDPRLAALSRLFRAQPDQLVAASASARFRNVDGVYRKASDIATAHPDYPGVATKGGRTTQEVVLLFVDDPSAMRSRALVTLRAMTARAGLHLDSASLLPTAPTSRTAGVSALARPLDLELASDPVFPGPAKTPNEFPERELMRVISDLLGIPHFTTSRGGSVRRDFLVAVAVALGADVSASMDKDAVLLACIRAATGAEPPPGIMSVGGTVTNRALQSIVDGITANGVDGAGPISAAVDVLNPDDDLEDEGDAVADLLVSADLDNLEDERRRRTVEQVAREGQDRFRSALVDAYGGRCAITGTEALDTLDAAHILPYSGPRSNVVPNGLLLRTDVHRLFDRALLAVDADAMAVVISQHLATTVYAELAGMELEAPRRIADRPDARALRRHRAWSRL